MKVRIVMMDDTELIGKIEVAHHGLEYVLKNHGSWISLFQGEKCLLVQACNVKYVVEHQD